MSSPPGLKRAITVGLLACTAVVGGCAGAPVQEMYNARQAVRAAERAGASTYAADLMGEARLALRAAENHLREGEYRTAQDEAEQARLKAVEARRQAEAATHPAGVP